MMIDPCYVEHLLFSSEDESLSGWFRWIFETLGINCSTDKLQKFVTLRKINIFLNANDWVFTLTPWEHGVRINGVLTSPPVDVHQLFEVMSRILLEYKCISFCIDEESSTANANEDDVIYVSLHGMVWPAENLFSEKLWDKQVDNRHLSSELLQQLKGQLATYGADKPLYYAVGEDEFDKSIEHIQKHLPAEEFEAFMKACFYRKRFWSGKWR